MILKYISTVIYFISTICLLAGLWRVSKEDLVMIGLAVWASDDDEENEKMPHIRHLIQSSRWLIASAVLAGLAQFLLLWSKCDL
ncbi:hypothetical protein LCGC14_1296640 [marine sediment metagenome]|uniref:Uncharacterized protein n=1 Tax=marine sediment metagenome TaxID=412755 RepID=A0A0F9LBG6_9ZZZZ